jgi:hypothetical protein
MENDEKLSIILNKIPATRNFLYDTNLSGEIYSYMKGANAKELFIEKSLYRILGAIIDEIFLIMESLHGHAHIEMEFEITGIDDEDEELINQNVITISLEEMNPEYVLDFMIKNVMVSSNDVVLFTRIFVDDTISNEELTALGFDTLNDNIRLITSYEVDRGGYRVVIEVIADRM